MSAATAAAPAPPGGVPAANLTRFLTDLGAARTDPAAWARLIDSRDPEFAARAEQLRENLAQLEVTFAATPRTHHPNDARRAVLGPTATAHAVRVHWNAPGTTAATHTLWFTLTSSDGRLRLAGVTDGPAESRAEPVWWFERVRVVADGRATVLAGAGVDPAPWLSGLRTARAELALRHLDPPDLVAQLPSDAVGFERVLGVRPGSHRHVAAAAWPFGDAIQLIVNPAAGGATTGEARQVLLTHEAVHVATGSVHRRGPLWLSEGYADLVALHAHPRVAAAHEANLAADQRRHGVATTLVSDAELGPANPRVDANYQRAWLTVRVLDRDDATADRVHAAVQRGTPIAEALAEVGWSEATLADAVRAELTRIAG